MISFKGTVPEQKERLRMWWREEISAWEKIVKESERDNTLF